MRLIDADALMKALGITDMDCEKCEWGDYNHCIRGSDFEDACSAIENAPTIEPELIRCKDCKHNSNTGGNYTNCDVLPQMFGRNPEDNYCSGAERREE